MPINKNIHIIAKNLDELESTLRDIHPVIGTFGGRQFINRTQNQNFTLDNIIDCFSKLSANEPSKKSKMREINARIKKLDEEGSLQLKNSFFLKRILTWIRQYFGSIFFNRSNELAKIEILMKELPSADVSIQEQIRSHLKNHPQLAQLLIDQSDEEIIHFIKYILETRNIYALNGNSIEHKQFLDSIIRFLRKEAADTVDQHINISFPNRIVNEENRPVAPAIEVIQPDSVLEPPRVRSHPRSALFDGVIDGRSQFPDGTVFHDDEIIREAEYIYSEPIDDHDPNVVARLTRDGKWVIQQQGKRACTAGVTAMLIKDHNKPIESIVSDIRSDDAVISDLEKAGLSVIHVKFEREPADKMDVLQKAIEKNGSAIVTIHKYVGSHAIIVDKITNEGVSIRDPYHGWAITVKRNAFEASLVLTEIIQAESNAALEASLHPEDFEVVANDEVALFLNAIDEFEDQEILYTYNDLTEIAASAFERADTALIALKKHASVETIRSYGSALLNALNVYNGIIRIKAANGINDKTLNSTLQNCNERLIQHYTVFDELSQRFVRTPQHTQNESIPRDLEDFVKKSCEGVSVTDAKQMIADGENLVGKIIRGEIFSGSKQDLINLSWFLMNRAVEIGQGFDEGAFVIEGESKKIHDFLLKSNADSPPYARPSTHFANRSPNSHWGIDIFDGMMPAHKRTLLFSMVKNQDGSEVLFIKPENFSARISLNTSYDAWMHGYEMIIAQRNKLLYPGSDDLPNMRKERVPSKILKDFKALLPKNPLKEVVAHAKLYGISFMHKYAKTLTTSEAKAFVAVLEDGYNHLDKRTGREVYLTL